MDPVPTTNTPAVNPPVDTTVVIPPVNTPPTTEMDCETSCENKNLPDEQFESCLDSCYIDLCKQNCKDENCKIECDNDAVDFTENVHFDEEI